LKRKRESFPLFVSRRYCIHARTFLGIPDRSEFQPYNLS